MILKKKVEATYLLAIDLAGATDGEGMAAKEGTKGSQHGICS